MHPEGGWPLRAFTGRPVGQAGYRGYSGLPVCRQSSARMNSVPPVMVS